MWRWVLVMVLVLVGWEGGVGGWLIGVVLGLGWGCLVLRWLVMMLMGWLRLLARLWLLVVRMGVGVMRGCLLVGLGGWVGCGGVLSVVGLLRVRLSLLVWRWFWLRLVVMVLRLLEGRVVF